MPTVAVLVHFEVAVNVPHKGEGGQEGHSAQHEEEDVAAEQSVAKELDSLQRAIHMRPFHEVEEGIHQHKHPCRPEGGGDLHNHLWTPYVATHPEEKMERHHQR